MRYAIFTLIVLFSFHLESTKNQEQVERSEERSPRPPSWESKGTLPRPHLDVVGVKIQGFSSEGVDKIQQAFKVLERVMNSELFRERILNFKNKNGELAFASNKGLTNEEIYDHLMEGREDLLPNTPHEMNFYLKQYYRPWSRVIGYTNPETMVINLNWKYFKDFEPYQVAANLAHEWVHKMGFEHKSAGELDSAPYAIGYIVEELGKSAQENRELFPELP